MNLRKRTLHLAATTTLLLVLATAIIFIDLALAAPFHFSLLLIILWCAGIYTAVLEAEELRKLARKQNAVRSHHAK